MDAIRRIYEDLPEKVVINIPKNLVHRKAEIIIITEDIERKTIKNALDFYGSLPDFPERMTQGIYESREVL